MITVTDKAAAELKNLLGDSGQALRLLVQKGGCAGHQYGMKLDDPAAQDTVVDTSGGQVVVDPESLVFLSGCELDFSDALTDSGFKIINPNAARSCGCGTSFEPAEEGKTPSYDPELDGSVCSSEEEPAETSS